MTDKPAPKAYYGRLQDVSLRTTRKGDAFVRARLDATGRDGKVLFSVQLVTYRRECVEMLTKIGNGGPAWCLGFLESVPQQQGKYTVRMLKVIQVRDSRAFTQPTVDA
jgi:hypothetical protein